MLSPGTASSTHAYANPGIYTVTLRVSGSDPAAGEAAATRTVVVVAPPPPPPPPIPPPATLGLPGGGLHVDARGHVSLPIVCVHATVGCAAGLKLSAVRPGASKSRAGSAVVLASGAVLLGPGRRQTLSLTLNVTGRKWLSAAPASGLPAILTATSASAAVPLTTATSRLHLIGPPKPKPKPKPKPAKKKNRGHPKGKRQRKPTTPRHGHNLATPPRPRPERIQP